MGDTFAVILAGGSQRRSTGPRAIDLANGDPLLVDTLAMIERLCPTKTIVVAGDGCAEMREQLGSNVRFIEQKERLGSGHAVALGLDELKGREGGLLVTYADRVYITDKHLQALFADHTPRTVATMISVVLDQPAGYARIIRDETDKVIRCSTDCELRSPGEGDIREVVGGAYWFDTLSLRDVIASPTVVHRRFNITECIEPLVKLGGEVLAIQLKVGSIELPRR